MHKTYSFTFIFLVALLSIIASFFLLVSPPLVFLVFGLVFIVFLFNRSFVFEAPETLMRKILLILIFLYLVWPRYLAFQFAGPDITPQRFFQFLLIFIWAISLVAYNFRQKLINHITENKLFFALFGLLFFWRLICCVTSNYPFQSFYTFTNETISNYLFILILYSLATTSENIEAILKTLLYATLVIVLVAIVEYVNKRVLFSSIHIPGMKLDSEYLAQAIRDKTRDGHYRTQSTFSNPLLLAQYVVFITPIIFYLIFNKSNYIKYLSITLIPFLAITGFITGSRAGLIVECAILLACSFFSVLHLTNSKKYSLLGWGLFTNCFLAILLVIWFVYDSGILATYLHGKSITEIQSTMAREQMLQKGMPLIMSHPFVGYGIGLSGIVLNFVLTSGMITIDSFYLSVALDTGIAGLIVFLLLPIAAIFTSIKHMIKKNILVMFLSLSILSFMAMMSILILDYLLPMYYLAITIIATSNKLDNGKIPHA